MERVIRLSARAIAIVLLVAVAAAMATRSELEHDLRVGFWSFELVALASIAAVTPYGFVDRPARRMSWLLLLTLGLLAGVSEFVAFSSGAAEAVAATVVVLCLIGLVPFVGRLRTG